MKHYPPSSAAPQDYPAGGHHAPPRKPSEDWDPLERLIDLDWGPMVIRRPLIVWAARLLAVPLLIYRGYAFLCGWQWLAVPALGVPSLGLAEATGLFLLVRYLTMRVGGGAWDFHHISLVDREGREYQAVARVRAVPGLASLHGITTGVLLSTIAIAFFYLASLWVARG